MNMIFIMALVLTFKIKPRSSKEASIATILKSTLFTIMKTLSFSENIDSTMNFSYKMNTSMHFSTPQQILYKLG